MSQYDASFFRYVNLSSSRSAAVVVPAVRRLIDVDSVLDVGCGQGAWLAGWQNNGVSDFVGLDGDYVDRDALLFDASLFRPVDLNEPFDLNRTFDLVQCLEVAEHIQTQFSETLVASLVAHADRVMFSAAPKGQGGDGHINEQSYEFWRRLFARHGFSPFDAIRPDIRGHDDVEPWYRFNTLLYVRDSAIADLPEAVRARRISDGTRIDDVSPMSYQLRKAVIRLLPVPVMTAIAKLKERTVVRWQSG